ncbi:MAG: hypothetical protein E4H14_00625 [Candidatus Thorarchaeota archaeon]|nr:MAG: hypothetical protein E4H14_00625 [Candidatus Thorarchaeota archaeon]
MIELPKRTKYAVKDVLNDLKKIGPSPSILGKIGSQLIYYEWTCCKNLLSDDHPVTSNLYDLLQFMEHDYEQQLVSGELWRVKDTPSAAMNDFLRGRSKEFLEYTFEKPAEDIRGLLEAAAKNRKDELKQFKKLAKLVKKEIKEDKENPDLWNKLRLILWMAEEYVESSEAFKTARDLGWSPETSALVAL